MKIKLIAVGKIKENYLKQGIAEYVKRLGAYTRLEIIEVKDEKDYDDEKKIKTVEGERILGKISPKDYVILLDIRGQELTSEEMASKLESLISQDLVFVIGGSRGVSPAVQNRANMTISFSHFTYPHQLMRLIFVEQLYRWFKIISHEPYHK